jgi:hypothetical protein
MKAGKNTPQSVLSYIDAVWAKNVPPEPFELAQELGISDIRLTKLRVKYRRDHGALGDEKLLSWLQEQWEEVRDRYWLLSKQPASVLRDELGEPHYGYTESPSESLVEADEGPPPNEIAQYRKSREARDHYQAEQMDEVGDLMAAMRLVRASLDALPADKKAKASRSIWAFKGRMDALEREIRRRLAA